MVRRSFSASCLFIAVGCAATPPPAPPPPPPPPPVAVAPVMTLDGLDQIIRGYADDSAGVQGGNGVWEFVYDGVPIACIADVKHGRMRLVSPVDKASNLEERALGILLAANFHSALDGRYAASGGIVYAAFIHPLGPLSEAEMKSAIRQVASLVKTYGTTFSSGELQFGGGGGGEAPPEKTDEI